MTSLVRKWRKFRALSRLERWQFMMALQLLPVAVFLLHTLGFKRSYHLLAWLPLHPPESTAQAPKRAWDTAWYVKLGGWYLPGKYSCLPNSLVLHRLLQAQDIASELQIGVRKKEDRELDAHAWVSYQDIILNDGADVDHRYAAFENAVELINAHS